MEEQASPHKGTFSYIVAEFKEDNYTWSHTGHIYQEKGFKVNDIHLVDFLPFLTWETTLVTTCLFSCTPMPL